MKQTIPRSQNGLLSAINLAIAGYAKHSDVILATNTGAKLTQTRNEAIAARNAHDAGRVSLDERREKLAEVTSSARAMAMLARDLLRRTLGRDFSVNWAGTGFSGSLRIPSTPEALEPLMESLAKFFSDHADKEVPALGVTAAWAGDLYVGLLNGRAAVAGQLAENRKLYAERLAGFDAIYKRLSGMVKELSQILTSLDARWLDYGFQIPGRKETPPVPKKPEPVVIGERAITVSWPRVARAEQHRVWVKVKDQDKAPRAVGITKDVRYTIEELQPGTELEIGISALNSGGESGVSELCRVTAASASGQAGEPGALALSSGEVPENAGAEAE